MDCDLKYDVVVAGAGIAGIAAAVAAARKGMKTALVEKQTLIGGLATSGLILVYLPLCDGNGTQVTFGIAEELLLRSMNYGPFDLPEKWGGPAGNKCEENRYKCYFNPAGFTLELDKILLEAGVELFLDTMVISAETDEKNAVRSIRVANASGSFTIEGKCFVDTTGDASLVRRAGGEFETGENYISPWWMENAPGNAQRYHFIDDLHIQPVGPITAYPRIPEPETGKSATRFTRTAWQIIRDHYEKIYAKDPSLRTFRGETSTVRPSLPLTTMASFSGPRIMMPSIKAWPPIVVLNFSLQQEVSFFAIVYPFLLGRRKADRYQSAAAFRVFQC